MTAKLKRIFIKYCSIIVVVKCVRRSLSEVGEFVIRDLLFGIVDLDFF